LEKSLTLKVAQELSAHKYGNASQLDRGVRLVQADHWTTFVRPPPITPLTLILAGQELCNSADRRAIPAVSG